MKTTVLGNSDLDITRIGLGTWAIGGSWEWGWGNQEEADSIKTIHAALDAGINWIDTAPAYGLGVAEEVIAKALKCTSHTPYVFTKCGLVWKDRAKGVASNSLNAASVRAEVESSLKRLEVETIDLMQIHWPFPENEIEQGWRALADMQKEGKIRHIGVSNCNTAQLKRVQEIAPVTSLQPPYSLVNPAIEQEVLPFCATENIGVINYSPMGSGVLSGKMTPERVAQMDSTDWRRNHGDFKERLPSIMKLVDHLAQIGGKHNATAGEVAIAWTLTNPAVTASIVGMRRADQIEGVIKAGTLELTAAETELIREFAHNTIWA